MGKRRRYHLGGAMLAERTGRAVVPVAHNAGDYWPRRGFLKRPGTIRLVIGKPIESEGRGAAEINARAAEWIESTVRELRDGAGEGPAWPSSPDGVHGAPRRDATSRGGKDDMGAEGI